jgi:sulfur-oxidizing protein SoxY
MMKVTAACLMVSILISFNVLAKSSEEIVVDPLNSPQWEVMHQRFLKGERFVFDDAVKVYAPEFAEDSMNVPVSFDASTLKGVKEVVVMADLNPIPLVLRYHPEKLKPYLAFRIKLQQGSPVRAAVKTSDNIWHVGGTWVDASGGGCTVPSVGTATGDWTTTLGKATANIWERESGANRFRIKIMHPMDTGLSPGIPRFHIEKMTLSDKDGNQLARLEVYEPISENPMLSLGVDKHKYLKINGRDNNGNIIDTEVVVR